MRQKDRRAAYYFGRLRALQAADAADDREGAERCRLQAQAVAQATNWPEFSELADSATEIVARLHRAARPSIPLG